MPNRFLGVKEVVADAMSVIPGGSTAGEQLLARQWAYIGLRDLGPSKDFIEVCPLTVTNLSIRKPDDLISTIDISLYDSAGNAIAHNYRPGSRKIKKSKPTTGPVISQIDGQGVELSEDDYYFHLDSTELARSAATALIRYYKFPVDDDGLPMIPEKARLAIIMFIRYMYTLRKGGTRFEVSSALSTWEVQRNRARSRMRMPSQMEYDAIAKSWMSMINIANFDNY